MMYRARRIGIFDLKTYAAINGVVFQAAQLRTYALPVMLFMAFAD